MYALSPLTATAPSLRPVAAPAAKSVGREFETLVLTNFIETMLPKNDAIYGSGTGADVWRSQLAQTIAAQLAQAGTLGIAEQLDISS